MWRRRKLREKLRTIDGTVSLPHKHHGKTMRSSCGWELLSFTGSLEIWIRGSENYRGMFEMQRFRVLICTEEAASSFLYGGNLTLWQPVWDEFFLCEVDFSEWQPGAEDLLPVRFKMEWFHFHLVLQLNKPCRFDFARIVESEWPLRSEN